MPYILSIQWLASKTECGIKESLSWNLCMFKIFINCLDKGIEVWIIRLADDIKLGGIANIKQELEKLNSGMKHTG